MSFAAVLATEKVAEVISSGSPPEFMHGPTFMGNPLACSIACASLDLLTENSPLPRIGEIEGILRRELAPAAALPQVADVRTLGRDRAAPQRRYGHAPATLRRRGRLGQAVRPARLRDASLYYQGSGAGNARPGYGPSRSRNRVGRSSRSKSRPGRSETTGPHPGFPPFARPIRQGGRIPAGEDTQTEISVFRYLCRSRTMIRLRNMLLSMSFGIPCSFLPNTWTRVRMLPSRKVQVAPTAPHSI